MVNKIFKIFKYWLTLKFFHFWHKYRHTKRFFVYWYYILFPFYAYAVVCYNNVWRNKFFSQNFLILSCALKTLEKYNNFKFALISYWIEILNLYFWAPVYHNFYRIRRPVAESIRKCLTFIFGVLPLKRIKLK